MPPPSVYADATALIALARTGRLDLLSLLPLPVRVTRHVWSEVVAGSSKPGTAALVEASRAGLLQVVAEGDPEAFPGLDAGESTVLSAAAARHAAVLLDERKARTAVTADPMVKAAIGHVTGVAGLILLAKRRGRLAAVRPVPDELIAQGFYMGQTLYRHILEQAGEG